MIILRIRVARCSTRMTYRSSGSHSDKSSDYPCLDFSTDYLGRPLDNNSTVGYTDTCIDDRRIDAGKFDPEPVYYSQIPRRLR